MGLDPDATETYLWAGDDQVDLAASDVEEWRLRGRGLVAVAGGSPVVFRWRALRDTVREAVWRMATSGLLVPPGPQQVSIEGMIASQLPFVRREAFAYGVCAVEGHPGIQFRQRMVPGGMRVADEVLDLLDGVTCEVPLLTAVAAEESEPDPGPAPTIRVRLIPHLGRIILDASSATEVEKKA